MKSHLQRNATRTVACVAALLCTPAAKAINGPPVKITMSADTRQAVSGEEYAGIFEVHLAKSGLLGEFTLDGPGWTVLALDHPTSGLRADAGLILVSFRAKPSDADQPLTLTLSHDGRRVTRTVKLGPAKFAHRGKSYPAVHMGSAQPRLSRPPAPADTETGATPTRGGYTIRVAGRIVYRRQDGILVGLDHVMVQVKDDDDLVEDLDGTIWEGETQPDGSFDTQELFWDGDLDGSAPDIYLRWECDTGIVDVEDGEWGPAPQPDWSWSTEDTAFHFEEFGEDTGGGYLDFGMQTSADAALMPAMHIHNSIVRAHRFIQTRSGIGLSDIEVLWPDGDNADYSCDFEEISISHNREWNESTHSHEYGHHFECEVAIDNSPDYCNGICDSGDCGHCAWCEENEVDAWHEGFPNWLADAITRSYETDYVDLSGCPYRPLEFRDGETPQMCSCSGGNSCPAGTFGPALSTEGFVHAMLRDMEDGVTPDGASLQDDHDSDPAPGSQSFDGIMDCMSVGPGPILQAVDAIEPDTLLEFLAEFRGLHPSETHHLWPTAFNVDPALLAGFPADTGDPSAVTMAASPTHPSGTGGPLPCILVAWEPPADDVTGANAYSYVWNSNPASPVEPDFTVDVSGTCRVSVPSPPVMPGGQIFIRIRARDHANHWGPSSDWLGPFVVTGDECALHDNGIPDVCDVYCNLADAPIACEGPILIDYCGGFSSCGTALDCNTNATPDDCDIAAGTSYDCGDDGIPDECQSPRYWVAQNGSWHTPENWDASPPMAPEPCEAAQPPAAPGVPQSFENVCIESSQDVTVSYTAGASTVRSLACREDLSMRQQAGFPTAKLTLLEPSFIQGDLTMTSGRITVNDELNISGALIWSGGHLDGPGQTFVTGAHTVSGLVALVFHTLNLQCDTLVTAGGFAGGGSSNFVIHNFPGYTYTQAEGIVHQANSSLFWNEGLILKPSGAGVTRLDSPVNNSGEIRAEVGSMRFGTGLISTGSVVGLPGTTLEFSGAQTFEQNSSLIGDLIVFSASAPPNSRHIRCHYDAGHGTTIQAGANVTFHSEAEVTDYGDNLLITSAVGHFEAVVGSTLNFQSMSVSGSAYFDGGDPIITQSLILGGGTGGAIWGPNKNITINGLLSWNNGASFYDSGVIHANGGVIIASGGTVKNLQSVLNNAAVATFLGHVSMGTGSEINNLATGVLDIQADGSILPGSQWALNNAGTLVKSAGAGTSTIGTGSPILRPQFTNIGTVEAQIGTLNFSWGSYTQTAGQTVLNGGNFSITGSPARPMQLDGGSLTGIGTVTANVNNAGGLVAPGLSPGQLNVTGSYTQSAAGALEIELGGPTPGIEFDWLNVTGTVSLAGMLRVGLIGGYIPAIGDQYVILTAGNCTGTFAAVEPLTPGLEVDVIYTPTTVVLEITGAGVPPATVIGAVLRKPNLAGPGGFCDLPVDLAAGAPVSSEPRAGGVTELRIAFDMAPNSGGANPVTIEEDATCPSPPAYGAYIGAAAVSAAIAGNELVLTFNPSLENARTYRIFVGAGVTSIAGQSVEIRSLLGDVDGSGRANALDRSVLVGVWTSSNFSCETDLDGNGRTHALDRGILIGAWTGGQNCAP